MSGEVRNVKVRLSVESAQAVAGVKQFGDAAEKSAAQAERAGARHQKAWDMVGRGTRNAALVGAGGLLLMERSVASFDKQMSTVDAATHETSKNMGLLREAAIKAGADTSFSATEAAAGITELAKAGVKTRAVLGGGLKGALDLAAAGQISVAESAETAASAMTQFQLKGKDVPHIADLLAAGAGKAQGSVHDLGMALNQSGLVASQTGLSIEDTTGTLAAFAKAGLIGSDAGTSFKTMLLSLNPRSDEAGKLMKKYNIEAYDAQGNFVGITKYAGKLRDGLKGLNDEQRAAALQTIFGTDAIRAANILYRNGAKGIDGWIKKVNDQGYAADTAGRQLDNLSGDVEKVKGSLETAFIKSGSGAQSGLRDVVQDVDGLIHKFNELPSSVQSNVVKTVAALTGLSAGVYGVTKVVKGVQSLKALTGAVSGKAVAGVGVQKVFVVNMGAGGLSGGTTGGVAGGTTGGVAGGTTGKLSKGKRLLPLVATGGMTAIEVAMAAGLNDQIQDALGQVGSRGREKGLLSAFDKGRNPAVSAVLGGTPLHTVKHDATAALDATKFGGKPAALESSLAKLPFLGGLTTLPTSLKNLKELDATLSHLNFQDPASGAAEFQKVVDKSGLSVDQLNKVLPQTAASMEKTSGSNKTLRDVLLGTAGVTTKFSKAINSLPPEVKTDIKTHGLEQSRRGIVELTAKYGLARRDVRTLIKENGGTPTKRMVESIIASARTLAKQHPSVKVSANTGGARAELNSFAAYLANVTRPRSVSVNVHRGSTTGLGTIPGGADGMTVPGARHPYGDKVLAHLAPGEEVITNRRGEADRFRADRAAGRIPAYADGGTVAAVTGGRAGDSVTVVFPAPAIYRAAVDAANEIAVSAAWTARSAADTRSAHLDDLHSAQRIRDLTADLRKWEKVTVAGKDGKDDDKSKKGMQDTKKTITRLAVRGLDRTVAQAELADARLSQIEARAQLRLDAITAINEARASATEGYTSKARATVRNPLTAIRNVERDTADLGAYGNVLGRLKAAGASPALLDYVQKQADDGDWKSATRLGTALLNQPGALGQLNASLGTFGQVAGNVAQLTTDPRFMSNANWSPTQQVVQQKNITVTLEADPSTWTTDLVRRVTWHIEQELAGHS